MTETPSEEGRRSYGCTLGCGNPYDVILVSPKGGLTLFLCMQDFFKTAQDMAEAMFKENDPELNAELAAMNAEDEAPFSGSDVRGRGHNAPVETTDPDLMEAYDNYVTADELPEELRG